MSVGFDVNANRPHLFSSRQSPPGACEILHPGHRMRQIPAWYLAPASICAGLGLAAAARSLAPATLEALDALYPPPRRKRALAMI